MRGKRGEVEWGESRVTRMSVWVAIGRFNMREGLQVQVEVDGEVPGSRGPVVQGETKVGSVRRKGERRKEKERGRRERLWR